jgi:metal-responsive CopG/Arc/MetJ family transcriptional regulator
MATGKTKTPRAKTGKGRTVGEEPTIVQVRFPRELLEAVDQEAQRLSDELGGEPVGRSEAIRIIVRRALMAKGK